MASTAELVQRARALGIDPDQYGSVNRLEQDVIAAELGQARSAKPIVNTTSATPTAVAPTGATATTQDVRVIDDPAPTGPQPPNMSMDGSGPPVDNSREAMLARIQNATDLDAGTRAELVARVMNMQFGEDGQAFKPPPTNLPSNGPSNDPAVTGVTDTGAQHNRGQDPNEGVRGADGRILQPGDAGFVPARGTTGTGPRPVSDGSETPEQREQRLQAALLKERQRLEENRIGGTEQPTVNPDAPPVSPKPVIQPVTPTVAPNVDTTGVAGDDSTPTGEQPTSGGPNDGPVAGDPNSPTAPFLTKPEVKVQEDPAVTKQISGLEGEIKRLEGLVSGFEGQLNNRNPVENVDFAGIEQLLKERLNSTGPDAITSRDLADFDVKSEKARAQNIEDLNALGLLRAGGDTIDVLGEFDSGAERGRLDVLASGQERQDRAIDDAIDLFLGNRGLDIDETAAKNARRDDQLGGIAEIIKTIMDSRGGDDPTVPGTQPGEQPGDGGPGVPPVIPPGLPGDPSLPTPPGDIPFKDPTIHDLPPVGPGNEIPFDHITNPGVPIDNPVNPSDIFGPGGRPGGEFLDDAGNYTGPAIPGVTEAGSAGASTTSLAYVAQNLGITAAVMLFWMGPNWFNKHFSNNNSNYLTSADEMLAASEAGVQAAIARGAEHGLSEEEVRANLRGGIISAQEFRTQQEADMAKGGGEFGGIPPELRAKLEAGVELTPEEMQILAGRGELV